MLYPYERQRTLCRNRLLFRRALRGGTRANIDEFTETTARGVEVIGGAEKGKAIIILNPAEPPMIMRDTIYAFSVGGEEDKIRQSVEDMVAEVQKYVPGYRPETRSSI